MGGLRELAAPFVAPGPCGVAIRDRLKHLTSQDEKVLRAVGEHQGRLASRERLCMRTSVTGTFERLGPRLGYFLSPVLYSLRPVPPSLEPQ